MKRTVIRSSAGKKLYAARDTGGQFKDIQDFARAHAADMRQTSEAEAATATTKVAGKKKAAKKAAKKATKKAAKVSATTKRVTKKATKKAPAKRKATKKAPARKR